jgi:rubrerythrin
VNDVIRSLKTMQRMERLATNVYKYQIRGFKGTNTATKLHDAYKNEKEHAGTLAKVIRGQKSSPSAAGFLFGLAGGIAGFFTLLIGKKNLFKIDTYIEEMAVKDYTKFVTQITCDNDTAALFQRIIGDEKRHVANWNAAVKVQKK